MATSVALVLLVTYLPHAHLEFSRDSDGVTYRVPLIMVVKILYQRYSGKPQSDKSVLNIS